MNAVEIEEAVSQLAEAPFDPEAFPYSFLEAFGNKATTIKRLKSDRHSTNQSDLPGGVLQRHNIHLKVCPEGEVTATLTALRESPATTRYKVKFILATDGKSFEAESLVDGETVACDYPDFSDHFGFFLPLAGITTVWQIRENAFDIKATGRLNRLYVELLKLNPDWDKAEGREKFNHFMARLIFCFFAEDTNIFHSEKLFTNAIAQMSAADAANTDEVLSELFRAMATPHNQREAAGIRNWANVFPYVNGGLFGPHPLTPSPKPGEGGQETLTPLSSSGRGAGGEGALNFPHPLTPSPKPGEGGQETLTPLSSSGRGAGGEGALNFPHPLTPSPKPGEGGQETLTPLSSSGRGAGGEGALNFPHPLTPSPKPGEGGQETLTPLSSSGRGAGGEGALNFPHPLTPSPKPGEGGQEALTPLSSSGRGAGGEGALNFPHPLTPSPKPGEGGQETLTPLSSSGRGAGGEGKYWEVPPALKKKMTEVARQFRKEPTPSEHILWQGLRGRKLEGRKFRRQQPIGVFIVDFFCGAERLIVEVDGGIHKSQQEADQQRQELLESLGLRVIRLSSELVETNLDEALAVIRQAFGPHPLTPSPKPGEGGQETLTPLSSSGRGAGGEDEMNFPHPLTPSPKPGEGGQETLTPLSSSGRGAGGEGALNFPHPLTPSPKPGEGGQETLTPLSSSGRGAGGEGEMNFPHPLTPSPKPGEGGQETLTPLSSSGRGAGGEDEMNFPHPLTPSPKPGEGGQETLTPLSSSGRGAGGEGALNFPHPLTPSVKPGEGGQETLTPLSSSGRGAGGEDEMNFPHPLTPSVKPGEGGQETLTPLSSSGRGAGGEDEMNFPHPLTPSVQPGEGGQETLTPLSSSGRGAGGEGVPRFNKIARSYLLHVGNLDWKKINPDIFGSMIQAVADEEERGALGMHYTSVPNILKVLNPLFLDDLRSQLEAAGENRRKLLNLRQRLAKIRVFDPACGSGNFLVIAYKEMRKIEAEINRRRGEPERPSQIPLTNFRGIEIRHFAAEIARLALIIAEYQCDVLHRGQMLALADFLPLKNDNWITCGNALRLDWLSLCPPTGTGVKVQRQDLDLWGETQDEAEIDFQNEGGETYICGNPPYKGSNWRTKEQTEDIGLLFASKIKIWKPLDYVCGWFIKASEYSKVTPTASAFVATNSICQGVQASILWPLIYESGQEISFAHTSFKWANLASHNAGVSVVIVGFCNPPIKNRKLYEIDKDSVVSLRTVENINAYLLNAQSVFVESTKVPVGLDSVITDGSGALDGGHLILNRNQRDEIIKANSGRFAKYILPYLGSGEFIKGNLRWCLWIEDENLSEALENAEIYKRVDQVRKYRENSGTRAQTAISRPHKFAWINKRNSHQIIVPTVFSERRDYITAGYLDESYVINNAASIIQEPSLYILAIISSTLHLSWVRAVSGKLEDRIRYTSSTCYNTFPVPTLTEQNKADLNRCAEDILLAREHYFPATIADMYDPKRMDIEFPLVREAHDRNDEIIERIYIGRRFKNDTERLEKLFDLYTKMTSQPTPAQKSAKRKTKS
ncbi:DNA methyltransferase [Limnospira fusiformis]|uniref:DNA methyltransferase n=5 Tax=Sirenicapillariaceae TaxID=2934961 RepID=UPI001874E8C8